MWRCEGVEMKKIVNFKAEYAAEIFKALSFLRRNGSLNKYVIQSRLNKNWVFTAPKDVRRTVFCLRKTGRFSHPTKRVLYLASNTWSSALEVNPTWKRKREVPFFCFAKHLRNLSLRNWQKLVYFIRIKHGIRLLGLNAEKNINELNSELNKLVSNRFLKNMVRRSISVRNDKAYLISRCFAYAVSKLGFDGIIYKAKSTLHGMNGPIQGSLNDPRLVIFEKASRKRKILELPPDEENLADLLSSAGNSPKR